MIDPENVPPVADNELLARFICYSDEKRSDGTVRHKLFLPYKLVELSVNRHREATLEETWQVGFAVAVERHRPLYGLANIRASNCRIETLDVKPAPQLPRIRTMLISLATHQRKKIKWRSQKCLPRRLKVNGNLPPKHPNYPLCPRRRYTR